MVAPIELARAILRIDMRAASSPTEGVGMFRSLASAEAVASRDSIRSPTRDDLLRSRTASKGERSLLRAMQSRASHQGATAVYEYRLSGDESASRRQQKYDHANKVLRRAEPAHRYGGQGLLAKGRIR